jgi:DNA-directed RNA polymerase specialized sigma24 family protein
MNGPRPSPERLAQLREAVAALPEPCRTILILCAVDGLDYRQISEKTGHSIKEIERAIAEGLVDIMRALDRMDSEPPPTLQ